MNSYQESQGFSEKSVRRSSRIAASLPIRVYATDFTGTDFIEDSTTVVVNTHGAKIRLAHQLIPDQEIRIVSLTTGQEAVFRVVSRVGVPEESHTYWGIECLTPARNVWGVVIPQAGPEDQRSVRAMVQCPICHAREMIRVDEALIESIQELGGLLRGCMKCGQTAIWEQVPYSET
jgi:hypothetical protein